MSGKFPKRPQSLLEEIGNSVTHGLGALLGIAGLVVLIVKALPYHDSARLFAVIVFGISIILLYTFSALYHALTNIRAKYFFKIMDHASIYLLIAGSYTPFLVIAVRGSLGNGLLIFVLILALSGILFKVFFTGRFKLVSVLLYIVMGWMSVLFMGKLVEVLPGAGIAWLVAGGMFYTLGTIFYYWDRVRSFHFVWHLFVLGGTVCHYFCVLWYVVGV